jgi:riboflavin biosynthesis pyrimidine reductase
MVRPVPQDQAELAELYAYPSDGRTWLRVNMISSMDGGATVAGLSGGLGGPSDYRIFHLLRGLADVILVGAQTVRAEGYGPVEREPDWDEIRQNRSSVPPLAVVSRTLDLDLDTPLFTEAPADARTIIVTVEAAPEERRRAAAERADVIVAGSDGVDFGAAVRELEARGHRRLHSEGGPTILAHMAAAGVLDELCLTISPFLVGGDSPRITHGPIFPDPHRYGLIQTLADDDYLFLRYVARNSESL